MRPILYESTEKTFSSMGLGPLSDALSAKVTEERNGIFELEMTYPVDGIHYADLSIGRIIMAVPSDGRSPQPFRIGIITADPIGGTAEIVAYHVSYDANYIPVKPFSTVGINGVFDAIPRFCACNSPFSFWTDINNPGKSFTLKIPVNLRKLLGGMDSSVLDEFHGEYTFDRWKVELRVHRGADNGVIISYGKNLMALNSDTDLGDDVVTGILPYYSKDDVVMVGSVEKVEGWASLPYERIIPVDLTSEFDSDVTVTEELLQEKALAYVGSLDPNADMSIKVSFASLWQTAEYQQYACLERVSLCDTVHVRHPACGTISLKVVKTVYDVLSGRYEEIELGTVRSSLASEISSLKEKQDESQETLVSKLESALQNAKDLFSGNLGGSVVINRHPDGKPYEIIFGDAEEIENMVHCIRIGSQGIGFSENGYNGPYNSAWTIEGDFAAENITTGYLDSERINADSITIGKLEKDAQALFDAVRVDIDGVHIYKHPDGKTYGTMASIMADGMHLYYVDDAKGIKYQIAWFAQNRAVVRNLTIANYQHLGVHRTSAAEIARMSTGVADQCTAHYWVGLQGIWSTDEDSIWDDTEEDTSGEDTSEDGGVVEDDINQ